jgi:hypothetical protein
VVNIIFDLFDDPHPYPIRESALNAVPDRFRSLNEPWFMASATVLLMRDNDDDRDSPGVSG